MKNRNTCHYDRAGPHKTEAVFLQTGPTKSYADFTRDLYQALHSRRAPIQGAIDLTWRCNLACAHCYNRLPRADDHALRTELTYEEHCRTLDEICDAGCLWLLYTGGEIFARDDFCSIVRQAEGFADHALH